MGARQQSSLVNNAAISQRSIRARCQLQGLANGVGVAQELSINSRFSGRNISGLVVVASAAIKKLHGGCLRLVKRQCVVPDNIYYRRFFSKKN